MASTLNRWSGIGRVGQDPEVKEVKPGVKRASFSIATSDSWKDQNGERKEKTEWHRIVAWRKLAEIIEKYLKKGQQVYVEGKLTSFVQTTDDKKIKYWEIEADQMQMLGSKSSNSTVSSSYPAPPAELDIPNDTAVF